MALIIRGKTRCPSCGSVLGHRHPIVSFPAFLPESHPLARFSDAAFHYHCFRADPDNEEVEALHDLYQAIWRERPAHLEGSALARWVQERGAAFLRDATPL